VVHCAICGASDVERSILAIGYKDGKIRINHGDESTPVFYICTNSDCIVEAKTNDLIGQTFGSILNAKDYLRIAQYAKLCPSQTLESLIGLSRKSGTLVLGTEGVIQKVKSGIVHLVLVEPKISNNTRHKLESVTNRVRCPIQKWTGSKAIEHILNKANCKVIGVTDRNLAQTIQENI